ncbi:hypothetical protein [Desulfotomaculum copahuensis]|uniref:Uncharacterized protein n=1 Tax=Desulfotomaculum copahuensis TaxID=1838280 RepID=A0A1B7LHL7_9FIRM|nr:hypothetical protein [Desulfotomaculum copahuensis]OAT85790.1 hypothetical protein A6M21_04670 [Desulfotomaculum copahuensis]
MSCNFAVVENNRRGRGACGPVEQRNLSAEKTCDLVDRCRQLIAAAVDQFAGEIIGEIPVFIADAALKNCAPVQVFYRRFLSGDRLNELVCNITAQLGQDPLLAGCLPEVEPLSVHIDLKPVESWFAQIRKTAVMSQAAAAISKWCCDRVFGLVMEGIGGEKVAGLIAGSIRESVCKQSVRAGEMVARERLALCLAGMVKNTGSEIKEELFSRVAVAVYHYYGYPADGWEQADGEAGAESA